MKKTLLILTSVLTLCSSNFIEAHCQMPCGIYHDDMVISEIDQYVETTVKCVAVLNGNKFANVKDRNEFIRWIMQKDQSSDDVACLITRYFLQQKIKPGEDDTSKKVLSAHRLLFLLMQIKQSVDVGVVKRFYEEWEQFKLMFHFEGYACELEKVKGQKWEEKKKKIEESDAHDHDDDDHDHDHNHDDHDHTDQAKKS